MVVMEVTNYGREFTSCTVNLILKNIHVVVEVRDPNGQFITVVLLDCQIKQPSIYVYSKDI